MPDSATKPNWGQPPWTIDFHPARHPLPEAVDFAVVGAGFSGLAAAARLRRIAPEKSVAVFDRALIGAGSSGHTGGMVLAETAAGDLPGLGDVLAGYTEILKDLRVDADLALPGVWEIGRTATLSESPISWTDFGNLRAVRQVPGGSVDPGRVLSGLARAAETSGVLIYEDSEVTGAEFDNDVARLRVAGKIVRAGAVLFATNAMSLELAGLSTRTKPKFTLAIATEPLSAAQLEQLGLASGKPFYTIDFPYLWGRQLRSSGFIFGAGLVHLENWRELQIVDVSKGEARKLIARIETRVRALHPALHDVQYTHRWGGPILIGDDWQPIFARHPKSPRSIVLAAFSGHGVAQSVYLGAWAAEALCGHRDLPDWNFIDKSA